MRIVQIYLELGLNEPRHGKTSKMSVRPAKTQISLGMTVGQMKKR